MHDAIKILTEDVEFHYHGRSLFSRVNLALPENTIIAITGPSGAGKSTFLSIFNRLWQEAGGGHCLGTVRIRFDGRMVDIYRDGMNVARLRRRVGMVFQSPNPLPMSIFKNVAFPLLLAGFADGEQIHARVEKMLQLVQLFDEVKDRLNADGRQLSGGQQQRLCLARALMLEPEVLLLDEPTSSLDPKSCETIENLLLELKRSCTLLVVSHYREQVRRVADQIYDLSAGQLRQVR